MRFIDLRNLKVRTFTVLELVKGGANPRWKCICECGVVKEFFGSHLRQGNAWCKCQSVVDANRIALQRVWFNMINRCDNPRHKSYCCYGARGIQICERWRDFENFASDMGFKPDGYSLERIDNNGNYEPSNCRWATAIEQMSNTRRNKYYTYKGETMTASAWSRKLGISREAFRLRILSNMPISKVFAVGKHLK